VLRGAVEANPKDSEAWLALANALSGHAQGSLSPAALYAYRQAAAADPKAPGPPFFLGLAMARAGRFDETRSLWAQLLAHAPADAKWRNDLAFRIEKLDKLMEMIRAQQAGGAAPGAPR
jgi:cytochrome c-type biogenesis protein CcmH